MERSSIIASVIAAGGVLIAGTVASVAVVNAAASSASVPTAVALVASSSNDTAPTPTGQGDLDRISVASPTATADLPEIPTVDDTATVSTQTSTPARTATSTRSAGSTATPERRISRSQASDLVRSAAGGGRVGAVARTTKNGFDAWAVQLTRSDGSIVTGYVDTARGVVFAWRVDRPAPTATARPTADDHDSSDDDSGHDSSDDNSGHGSDDRHGSDDNSGHGGSDHDEDDD